MAARRPSRSFDATCSIRGGSAVAVGLDHCLTYEEVRDLRDRLVRENVHPQEQMRREHPVGELVGASPTLLAALHKVDQVVPAHTSGLIVDRQGADRPRDPQPQRPP